MFVIDSQRERLEANLESYEILSQISIRKVTISADSRVIQYNKGIFPAALPAFELSQTFNGKGLPVPEYEAVANKGLRVFETLTK